MFEDNKRPHNASRILAIVHLDTNIRSSVVIGASDPAYDGGNLTERVTTRSLFVAKHPRFVVFELPAIRVRVKIKTSHQFPYEMNGLSRGRRSGLVIASHDLGFQANLTILSSARRDGESPPPGRESAPREW